MDLPDLTEQPAENLFALFARVMDELRRRGLVRSSNNPVADYAEHLAAAALGLSLAGKSDFGYDGKCGKGVRYQVKGRRLTSYNNSRQLSFMRGLDKDPFDFLVGILFDENMRVFRACVVPIAVVREQAAFSAHVNAHRLILRDSVWTLPGVRDITDEIKAAASRIGTAGPGPPCAGGPSIS